MSNITQNQYDTTGRQMRQGIEGEEKFQAAAQAAGWLVEAATPEQDLHDHIDFTITRPVPEGDPPSYTVDVKNVNAPKGKVWVEMRNVNGNAGWLYGKADFIAFSGEKGFTMVERDHLRQWIEENGNKGKDGKYVYVTNKRDALMNVYTRKNRKDMLMLVNDYHIVGLSNHGGGMIPYAN